MDDCTGLSLTCRQLQGLYTHRTNGHQDGHLLSMEPTVTHMQAVPSHGRAEPSQQLQTTPSTPTAPRTTPVASLSHALASTRAHHTTERSVSASQTSQNRRSSTERFCRSPQPFTAASIASALAQAPAPCILMV
jgi:hypothetical protein